MKKKNNNISPDWIDSLSQNEVFVFGSNLEGQHAGGAARIAYNKFGAEWGVGVGMTGRCYAIPTMHGGLDAIRPYVKQFVEYAIANPNKRFLLTRIGCGIAGFSDVDMCLLFSGGRDYPNVLEVPNIAVPKKWLSGLVIDYTLGIAYPKSKRIAIEGCVSEERLRSLCQEYSYQIGAGTSIELPSIRVRYVEENGKFGYTDFGDFFFHDGAFYVITTRDEFASEHNQEVMEQVFHDECVGRGYAVRRIFAGVSTGYKDQYDKMIYTGDVVKVWRGDRDIDDICDRWALGDWHTEESDDYAFILDNHNMTLSECYRMKMNFERIGTVFYQLNANDRLTLRERVMCHNGWHDTTEETETKLIMARYTPNFDQKVWKYRGLDILGVEEYF